MGLAERITDRQLRRGDGLRAEVLRQGRRRNRLAWWLLAMNVVAVAAGLAGHDGPVRTFWSLMSILWLAFGYIIFRQRRYLITLADEDG